METSKEYKSEKIKNIANTYINPSTIEKQDEIIEKLSKELKIALTPVFANLIQAIAEPVCIDKSANQLRVQATVSSGTIKTVSTVSNLSTIDSMQGRLLMYGQDFTAWSSHIHNTIS